jgi:hypothetical protein
VNGQSDIMVGNFRIGRLTAESATVRGEGGVLSPALVVPLILELQPRKEEETLAVTEIEADLLLGSQFGTAINQQVANPARSSPLGTTGGLWCTAPNATNERQLTLRFALMREHVRLFEDRARRLASEPVPFELRLRIGAAWVRRTENAPRPGPAGHPMPPALGFVSELWPAWEAKAEPLRLELAREHWVAQILPNLGADRVRLVAVRLPATNRALGDAGVAAFEDARVAYDSGEYRRAVQACRDLREAIERQLGAVEGARLADRVAERLGWPEDSPAKELLDNLWKALSDVSSAANHHRGRQLAAADSRLAILLAASAMEYLVELLEPDG